MSVQDRIKEYAVLQTLGLRPLRIFNLVILESLLLSILGGILGVAGSVLLLSFTGMSVSAEGVTIAFEPTLALMMQGIVVAIVVGLLAGLVPGWHASRMEIVPALRHG